jgi:hypothetical protein
MKHETSNERRLRTAAVVTALATITTLRDEASYKIVENNPISIGFINLFRILHVNELMSQWPVMNKPLDPSLTELYSCVRNEHFRLPEINSPRAYRYSYYLYYSRKSHFEVKEIENDVIYVILAS